MDKTGEGDDLDNFVLDRNWLSLITGHAESRSTAYSLYIGLIYLSYVYFLLAACATLIVLPPDKELLVKTTHVIVLLIWAASVLACRIVLGQSLAATRTRLMSGVFRYEGEPRDPEADRIRREGLRSLRGRSDLMARLFLFSGFSNLVIYPLTQMLTLEGDTSESHLNPYLNQPLYMPFDTRTVWGYSAGVLLNLVYSVVIYGLATSMNDIHISYTGALTTQLRLLNHSLRQLKSRAWRMYTEREGLSFVEAPTQELLRGPVFKQCLARCLRSNVMHHIAIWDLKNSCRVYVGSTLLILMSLVAVVLATTLSLLLEKLPPNKFANYLLTGVAEVVYPFMLCYFGEDVLQESSKTYGALYDSPWMEGDSRFKRLLLNMMTNARAPMRIKTTIFNFTASLNTFGDIVSNMYKIINLIRQSHV